MSVAAKPGYAELHAISNFSFLRGASHPEELVLRAEQLGYAAIAITDECSLAGVVRAHGAAKECDLALIIGAEFRLEEGLRVVLLATDRAAYGRLARLVTRGRRAADKGSYRLAMADLESDLEGCLALWLPGDETGEAGAELARARWVAEHFPGRAWLAVERLCGRDDRRRLAHLGRLGARAGLPLTAAGDVHMHSRARRALQDTLSAIRLGCTVATAGLRLHANGERHLRSRERLARLYPRELLTESVAIAARCDFSLDELRYEYPRELVPEGLTPGEHLRALTEEGIRRRWPRGISSKLRGQIEHELALIADLQYEPYFLTVQDMVCFARERNILCQGRGSAANSAVCFCLGITEVDPARMEILFERFISRERNEPPDIDVDFEHERREEVIQYIYEKYGRERTAIAATVITYQPRSTMRDVGKALGFDAAQVDRLAKSLMWWDGKQVIPERFKELGFDPDNPVIRRLATLVESLLGFPRHLSQHTGGFVIARDDLSALVPIENAAMADRTVIQWDKDDLEALGLLKVDVLALGMLTAIHKSFDLIAAHRARTLTMATVPAEDPEVYAMIQHADTVGVFQIESRAQMAMLPRMRPACFYDLVIEVAIVRPGPIQGGMVHPYLRRRQGIDPVTYPSQAVRGVLERTLGVPIFQEQVMQLAVVAAGFSPGEADRLRRAMAAWRRRGGLAPFEERLISGMRARGYDEAFARQIFQQIQGFGDYGFPESHSASFALLVYVSAWLKYHEPAVFARRHGVEVRPVEVGASFWDCTLEKRDDGEPALRLGFRMIKGFSEGSAEDLVAARGEAPFASVTDVMERSCIRRDDMNRLAAASALERLAGNRHRAHWQVLGVEAPLPLTGAPRLNEAEPMLPVPGEGRNLVADFESLGLTLGRHPVALLRRHLASLHMATAAEIRCCRHGEHVRAAGIVINRQRPSTASGVIFMTLEDETGHINVVVWPWVVERQRREVVGSRMVGIHGTIEREGEVVHLVVNRIVDLSHLLGRLHTRSRDFS
jgi:error-prone DNA polymerase